MSPRVSVFCGLSVDGFIARPDHTLNFLPEEPEDHGFGEFYASVDVLLMGRNTYDVMRKLGPWPYGAKPVVVLSSRAVDCPVEPEAVVERMQGEPVEVLARLAERGWRHVYVDGGITVTRFLAAGCVDRLILTRVPVLIGAGIPLFGALPGDVRLQHVATRTYASGLVQSEYLVKKGE